MKVGDLVKCTMIKNSPSGIVVQIDPECGWLWVLTQGKLIIWPETQMELINENR